MPQIKKTLHVTLAIFLILMGIAGLVLPLLNGILLLLLGFILLSFESPYMEKHLTQLAHRYNMTGSLYDKLYAWMKKLFRV
jgi:uncharacterized membrane protein YbaN (DUF454 family)